MIFFEAQTHFTKRFYAEQYEFQTGLQTNFKQQQKKSGLQ